MRRERGEVWLRVTGPGGDGMISPSATTPVSSLTSPGWANIRFSFYILYSLTVERESEGGDI